MFTSVVVFKCIFQERWLLQLRPQLIFNLTVRLLGLIAPLVNQSSQPFLPELNPLLLGASFLPSLGFSMHFPWQKEEAHPPEGLVDAFAFLFEGGQLTQFEDVLHLPEGGEHAAELFLVDRLLVAGGVLAVDALGLVRGVLVLVVGVGVGLLHFNICYKRNRRDCPFLTGLSKVHSIVINMVPESIPQRERGQGQEQEVRLIDQDPYGPSYKDSAIQYMPYRIGILVCAVVMIFLGQSNLPSNPVPCIEDAILDALQPVTDFYAANQGFGLTVVSLMQLLVDAELVGMLAYWFLRGDSLRYAIVMAVVGLSKVLLNVLFQTRLIPHSFNEQAFPSLVFGPNFRNTYFFSGVTCLLMVNLLQFWQRGFKRLFLAQLAVMAYVIFVLLSARQNFFMDITTALVFSHFVFYFVNDRVKAVDGWAVAYLRLTGSRPEE